MGKRREYRWDIYILRERSTDGSWGRTLMVQEISPFQSSRLLAFTHFYIIRVLSGKRSPREEK